MVLGDLSNLHLYVLIEFLTTLLVLVLLYYYMHYSSRTVGNVKKQPSNYRTTFSTTCISPRFLHSSVEFPFVGFPLERVLLYHSYTCCRFWMWRPGPSPGCCAGGGCTETFGTNSSASWKEGEDERWVEVKTDCVLGEWSDMHVARRNLTQRAHILFFRCIMDQY